MTTPNGRRGFLGLLGLLGMGTATTTSLGAERPDSEFTGTSKSGDFKEALAEAIAAAMKSAGHTDAKVEWTIKRHSGVSGTIAGLHSVTVVIEAKVS